MCADDFHHILEGLSGEVGVALLCFIQVVEIEKV